MAVGRFRRLWASVGCSGQIPAVVGVCRWWANLGGCEYRFRQLWAAVGRFFIWLICFYSEVYPGTIRSISTTVMSYLTCMNPISNYASYLCFLVIDLVFL